MRLTHGIDKRLLNVWMPIMCVVGLSLLSACESSRLIPHGTDLRTRFNLQTLPSISYPADNQPRQERIALGRLLFFDPILAGEMDVSCGTCHHPSLAFADSRQFGAGVSGSGLGPTRIMSTSAMTGDPVHLEPRNTPTVLNAAFNGDSTGAPSHLGLMFWDGRRNGIEALASLPIASRVEMRGDAYPGTDLEAEEVALDSVLHRLREIPEYVTRFEMAFPVEAVSVDPMTPELIIDSSTYARAIASYVRELVTRNSAYDRYVNGEDDALSAQQKHGLELFLTKAKCSSCHSGPMFSDFSFIVQGVPQEGTGKETLPGDDLGRAEETQLPTDMYAFKTPSLRNVELTAPYMHDGVFESLEEVLRFYNEGAHPRHTQVTDGMLAPILVDSLHLTDGEIEAIIAFMRSLTDAGTALPPFLTTVPESVPSGLMPVFGVEGPGPGIAARVRDYRPDAN